MQRSGLVRATAVLAAILLLVIGWYLGSPLFIRTTTDEPIPTTIATAPSPFPSIATTGLPRVPNATAETGITILRRGQLQYVDALHNGKGAVLILDVEAHQYLRFENVAITNAPDVHVYLAKSRDGAWSEQFSTYVGPLKATNGSFNYELPANTDIAAYGSVVVWCRAFSVLVTWANLERP